MTAMVGENVWRPYVPRGTKWIGEGESEGEGEGTFCSEGVGWVGQSEGRIKG